MTRRSLAPLLTAGIPAAEARSARARANRIGRRLYRSRAELLRRADLLAADVLARHAGRAS